MGVRVSNETVVWGLSIWTQRRQRHCFRWLMIWSLRSAISKSSARLIVSLVNVKLRYSDVLVVVIDCVKHGYFCCNHVRLLTWIAFGNRAIESKQWIKIRFLTYAPQFYLPSFCLCRDSFYYNLILQQIPPSLDTRNIRSTPPKTHARR